LLSEGDPRKPPSWYAEPGTLDWYPTSAANLHTLDKTELEALHHFYRAQDPDYGALVKKFERVRRDFGGWGGEGGRAGEGGVVSGGGGGGGRGAPARVCVCVSQLRCVCVVCARRV